MPTVPSFLLPIVLQPISNVFMTLAWYGHPIGLHRPRACGPCALTS
jgi:uncharacterized protein (DUF486 family)